MFNNQIRALPTLTISLCAARGHRLKESEAKLIKVDCGSCLQTFAYYVLYRLRCAVKLKVSYI